jgi:bifunctional non-homologous end joining protein LigD
MVPHLRGRPTSLVRCPEGIAAGDGSRPERSGRPSRKAGCFFQKHLAYTVPAALRRIPIKERNKVGQYVVADDVAGLVALAQLDILEIHTWNSREEHLEQPDRVVFDLDPDESLPWGRVVAAARQIHQLLLSVGLTSFVKTTGGKGLHIEVPFEPGPDWAVCAAFCRTVAETLARLRPATYTSVMSKARRQGKIYVDHLRNVRGATAINVYSTRARPGAPVSIPVAWGELDSLGQEGSRGFRLRNVLQRLAGMKVDPWKSYFEVRQQLPVPRAQAASLQRI